VCQIQHLVAGRQQKKQPIIQAGSKKSKASIRACFSGTRTLHYSTIQYSTEEYCTSEALAPDADRLPGGVEAPLRVQRSELAPQLPQVLQRHATLPGHAHVRGAAEAQRNQIPGKQGCPCLLPPSEKPSPSLWHCYYHHWYCY